jgi:hypothetical protein
MSKDKLEQLPPIVTPTEIVITSAGVFRNAHMKTTRYFPDGQAFITFHDEFAPRTTSENHRQVPKKVSNSRNFVAAP